MSIVTSPIDSVLYRSPDGPLELTVSDIGVQEVNWIGAPPSSAPQDEDSGPQQSLGLMADLVTQLDEYFAGERKEFDLPLDLQGTEFQKEVWEGLVKIPYGETVSYSQQAEMLGRSGSERAVASANGKNPVAIVLPCHRVIGADGSLRGYNGGLAAKQALLDLESGVALRKR